MQISKLSVLLVVGIVFAGCATKSLVPLQIDGLERSTAVRVHDRRPVTEKQAKGFSLLITSSAYGVYRVPEDTSGPSAIRLLQHRAYEKFGTRMEPLEITVYHLVTYLNWQVEARSQALAAGIASVGGAGINHTPAAPSGALSSLADRGLFESLSEKEHQRGWYSAEENPGGGSVFVIYLDTEIAGRRVFTRTIAPEEGNRNPFKGRYSQLAPGRALEAAIRFHLAQYQ